ncbi:GerAB/ArcD/ProY family transporter [Bacillus sp. EAC]|uniref:GerAB/ArcD/ProY family transporter n=1 Tax=Bacillus sp. EAC TaxID=1978338 RepID=UPI000B43CF0C|nr:GerAB/ArcD/ProY family transporter [Bacillus sp. EAC]
MNRKLTISGFQFFCIIYLFEIGSSSLIALATASRQDAWLSLLVAIVCGCLLFYVYIKLFEMFPDLPLTKYVQKILGKYVGKIMAVVYILYFIYIGGRVLRDFEELLVISLYNSTSLISIGILMIFLVMYAIYKGFEVFARVNEFSFYMIMFIIITVIGFEVIAKLIKIDNLRPTLESGWLPVFKAAFPLTVTFPFGEIITLAMLMPHLKKKEYAMKVGLPAMIFAGLTLTTLTVVNISILGVDVLERASYPILTAVSYINIANFIQRLDSLIVIVMVLGGFIKISVFFFCAVHGAGDLFGIKKSDTLTYPIGVIIVLISVWMAPNYLEHYKEGLDFVPFYLHIPLQMIIPIALLIIAIIQKKVSGKEKAA